MEGLEGAAMYQFKVGFPYTRKEIFSTIGIGDPGGGNWYTGYTAFKNDWFLFCGVGTAGRTGHDYHNHFHGDELVWFGKTKTRITQPSIQSLLKPLGNVYIFYRESDREPFTFAGLGYPKETKDSSPVMVVWGFRPNGQVQPEILPQEVSNEETVFEGAKKLVTVNIYERDPNARRKCIAHWGLKCLVCGFDFSSAYGDIGQGFIHVHHLKPLSEIGGQYSLDPIKDLRPVCPNCHAMLHREIPAMSIESLGKILAKYKPS
jgi:5-methylcytosine-specific restriction protein A